MKMIIFLLLSTVLLLSCEPKTEIDDKGRPDPNALIVIKPGKSSRAIFSGFENRKIVEDAWAVNYTSHYFGNVYYETPKKISRGFNEHQKDFDIPALKMLGIDVIDAEGNYYRDLTYSTNVYIINRDWDTIAYIKDDVIYNAKLAIEAALQDNNYNTVYELFNTAFTFLPIE